MRNVEFVTLAATLVGTAATIASIRLGKRKKPSPIQRWRAHRNRVSGTARRID